MLKYLDLKIKYNKTKEGDDALGKMETELARLNYRLSCLCLQAGINNNANLYVTCNLLKQYKQKPLHKNVAEI